MGKLKTLSGIEVFRILEAHGFEKVRQRGSHVVMQKRTSESTVTVPVLDHKEITSRAQNALIRELGVVDTIRFLNQFRAGSGDYTTEREELFKQNPSKVSWRRLRRREISMPNKTLQWTAPDVAAAYLCVSCLHTE